MKLRRKLGGFALLLSALVALAWLSLPQLAGLFLRGYLGSLGLGNVSIQIESVGFERLRIKRLRFAHSANNSWRVDIYGADLSFSLGELSNKSIRNVSIASAVIDLGAAQASPEPDTGEVLTLLARPWHQHWPVHVLSVRTLTLYRAPRGLPRRLSLNLTRREGQLTAQIGLWQKTGTPRYIDLNLSAPGELRGSLHAVTENTMPAMVMDLSLKERSSQWHLQGRLETNLELFHQWLKPGFTPGALLMRVCGGRAEFEFSLRRKIMADAGGVPWRASVTSRFKTLAVSVADEPSEAGQGIACRERTGVPSARTQCVSGIGSSAQPSPKILRIAAASFQVSADIKQRPRQGEVVVAFRSDGQVQSLQAHPVILGNAAIHLTGTLSTQGSTTELAIGPEATATLEALGHPSVHLPHLRISAAKPAERRGFMAEGLLRGIGISLPAHWQITLPPLREDQFQFQGNPLEIVLGDVAWSGANHSPSIAGGITTANVLLQIRDRVLPCQQVRMDFVVDRGALRTTFEADLAEGAGHLHGELMQSFGDGGGRVTFALSDLNFEEEKTSLSRILQEWPYAFDLLSGKLAFSGEFSWPQNAAQSGYGTTTGTLRIRVSDGGGFYQEIWFSGLETDFTIRLAPTVRTARSARVKVDIVDFGLPLKNVELTLALLHSTRGPLPRLVVYDLKGELLEGELTSKRVVVDANNSVHHIPLQLRRLNLAELLTLYPFEGLQASGVLNGVLDLMVSHAGVSVQDGTLRAAPPGGGIRYRSDSPAQRVEAAVPGSAVLFRALEDFRYEVLRAEADYAVDGTLLLNLHLEGRSPRLQADRAVHVNLNLEQNVLSLLRSLRLVNGLNEQLASRVRTYYEESKAHPSNGSQISP
ncbi:MAG: YdbH domain-containing protein [Gammaproteobacteria bacterium]